MVGGAVCWGFVEVVSCSQQSVASAAEWSALHGTVTLCSLAILASRIFVRQLKPGKCSCSEHHDCDVACCINTYHELFSLDAAPIHTALTLLRICVQAGPKPMFGSCTEIPKIVNTQILEPEMCCGLHEYDQFC